ncbi:MAG: hypothetical protein ACR2FY_09505 [Pirellulaceae bacterium]
MVGNANDLVSQIVDAHVAIALRNYGGNFCFESQIVEKEWLPAENEPGVQHHLELLRQHLAKIGCPEDDTFVLRLGLTVPGMQRGIVPPYRVLEANRGGFSARRLREAERYIIDMREALAIARRFFPSLSTGTQQAVAELADLSQRQLAPKDMDWLKVFGELKPDEAEQLAKRAVDCLSSHGDSVKEIGTNILQRLASFRFPPLSEACCHATVEWRVFSPPSLYRESGDDVAVRIISLINETPVSASLNQLLLALAWTRSAAALHTFQQWSKKSPIWASELYVPPEEYLPNAGWCLSGDGLRRDLIVPKCVRLVPSDGAAHRSIPCRTRSEEMCPSCGGPLSWLFDFSQLGAEDFSSVFAEAPLKVLCCLHCACSGPVFSTYRADGTAAWLSPNGPSEFAYSGDRAACVRRLADSPCPPFACAEVFALDDASSIGGIPMWLQDAEFPRCIKCRELMTFLAQHDNGSLREEGIYYAFFCAPCHVAAVNYQQT